MATIGIARETNDNPLDVVEHLAAGNSWPFERAGEDEISIVVTGRWTNYQISFTWMSDIEALHLACAFDMRVPELRLAEVRQLVALINEQMWIGHFDVWQHNGVVMFRHALVLAGSVSASDRQCEAVLGSALDSGPANPPANPWMPPCSRPPARLKAPVIPGGQRPNPASIAIGHRFWRGEPSRKNRDYGFRARGLCPRPGMTAKYAS
jgi:hypothetical protein